MAVVKRSFVTVPGASIVSHPAIYGVRMLGVEREGVGYTKVVSLTPINRQFDYRLARIKFDSANPFNVGEIVWALYET